MFCLHLWFCSFILFLISYICVVQVIQLVFIIFKTMVILVCAIGASCSLLLFGIDNYGAEHKKKIVFFFFVRMIEFSISNVRYTYVHDQKYSSEVVDIHHIISRRSNARYFFVYATTLLLLACALYLYVHKVSLPTVCFSMT